VRSYSALAPPIASLLDLRTRCRLASTTFNAGSARSSVDVVARMKILFLSARLEYLGPSRRIFQFVPANVDDESRPSAGPQLS